jgi:hypothetical protein
VNQQDSLEAYVRSQAIISDARAELDAEEYRAAVEAQKERLRARFKAPWWRRLFPWTITIKRSYP